MLHAETQMSIPPQYQWARSALFTTVTDVWTATWYNLAPIVTKNIICTILYYILHKEVILHPDPQCITDRYSKSNGLICPTLEKM